MKHVLLGFMLFFIAGCGSGSITPNESPGPEMDEEVALEQVTLGNYYDVTLEQVTLGDHNESPGPEMDEEVALEQLTLGDRDGGDLGRQWETSWAEFNPYDPALLPSDNRADGNVGVSARYRGDISGTISPYYGDLSDPEIELNVHLGTGRDYINAKTYFNGETGHYSSYSTTILENGSFSSFGNDNEKGFNGQFYHTDTNYGMVRGAIRTPYVYGTYGAELE